MNSAGFIIYRNNTGYLTVRDTNDISSTGYGIDKVFTGMEYIQFNDITFDLSVTTFDLNGLGWGTAAVKQGTAGYDTLNGTNAIDEIYGNDGNDSLAGFYANDTLNGGNGNDGLDGNQGNDLLIGGAGDDDLHGNEDNDTLSPRGGECFVWKDWLCARTLNKTILRSRVISALIKNQRITDRKQLESSVQILLWELNRLLRSLHHIDFFRHQAIAHGFHNSIYIIKAWITFSG